MKTLVIPDSHVKVGVSNRRFEWLGNLIVETQPDIIVNLDDQADLESLYNLRAKTLNDERQELFDQEIELYHDANRKIFDPIEKYNNTQARFKKKKYQPRKIIVKGNHTHRLDKWQGTKECNKLLRFKENGYEVYEYLYPAEINGTLFAHYFYSDRIKPWASNATELIECTMRSAVCGHTHRLSFECRGDVEGKKYFGLSAGCYLDPEQIMDYLGPQGGKDWWSGVTMLHEMDREPGFFSPEFIAINEVIKEYA